MQCARHGGNGLVVFCVGGSCHYEHRCCCTDDQLNVVRHVREVDADRHTLRKADPLEKGGRILGSNWKPPLPLRIECPTVGVLMNTTVSPAHIGLSQPIHIEIP